MWYGIYEHMPPAPSSPQQRTLQIHLNSSTVLEGGFEGILRINIRSRYELGLKLVPHVLEVAL